MIRWLSRDRSGLHRVTGTPLAVRVVDVPDMAAPEMPPRPRVRRLPRPDPVLPPVTAGVPFDTCGPVDAAFDPCGAPPVAPGKNRRRAQ